MPDVRPVEYAIPEHGLVNQSRLQVGRPKATSHVGPAQNRPLEVRLIEGAPLELFTYISGLLRAIEPATDEPGEGPELPSQIKAKAAEVHVVYFEAGKRVAQGDPAQVGTPVVSVQSEGCQIELLPGVVPDRFQY